MPFLHKLLSGVRILYAGTVSLAEIEKNILNDFKVSYYFRFREISKLILLFTIYFLLFVFLQLRFTNYWPKISWQVWDSNHRLLASEADALPMWHQPTKHHDKKMHIFFVSVWHIYIYIYYLPFTFYYLLFTIYYLLFTIYYLLFTPPKAPSFNR